MITHTDLCPGCRATQRFVPEDAAVYAEGLRALKASGFGRHDAPGAEDHQLYGYLLAHCPTCSAAVIIHFNLVLHRYLALVEAAFPEAFRSDRDVPAIELFRALDGELGTLALDPMIDLLEL